MDERFWHKGAFWMGFWIVILIIMLVWGTLTFILWMDSVPNLNALSVVAVWLACGAGVQATLGMRKADQNDKF
jgi:hypothetical protein